MSISVSRRADDLVAKKVLIEKKLNVEKTTVQLRYVTEKKRKLIEAREYYAAARIQGIIRGFIARLLFQEKVRIYRATVMIQKVVRGKLGRIRWMREYWLSRSVVKSSTALVDLVQRSRIVRTDGQERGWKEMFDSVTFGFWYYHEHYGMNTWNCPLALQKELVCRWDGYHKFGGAPFQKRCRCVFDNMLEYQGHMIKAHRWYCPSCEAKNTGLVFPECATCGNTLSEDGESAVDMLEEHAKQIDRLLDKFSVRDKAFKNPDYKFKDRFVQIALALRQDKEEELEEQKRQEAALRMAKDTSTTFTSLLSRTESAVDELPSLTTEKDIFQKSGKTKPNESAKYKGKNRAELLKRSATLNVDKKINETGTIPPLIPMMQNRIIEMPPIVEKDDSVLHGIIPPSDFDIIIEDKTHLEVEPQVEEEDTSTVLTLSGLDLPELESKLQVCREYVKHNCSKTTCPFAHPHIRDKANIIYMRIPGMTRRVPFVEVCEESITGSCPNEECEKYHIYIRPPTIEIIKRMYPVKEGTKLHVFDSGARLEGNVKGEQFHGYAIMTWHNKDTYLGDWKQGLRHGFGIYRSHKGIEYVGKWKFGKKDGWGVLTHCNGDEYIGEFENGKLCGVGRLSSANGDVYEGTFVNGKYHGFGTFRKMNGDVYMGFCKEGMADGVGVLALHTGEKYKGYFSRDARHGKGVCAYKNGSKYAGMWFRGLPDGFGVYLTPPDADGVRERYVGEWSSGMKHGKGRYFFRNGDFYDGDFHKNFAKGMGVYVHTKEGNIYRGEWDRDMRNGRGTYNFANGSRYTGGWVDNNIHGKGKFDYACGSFYRGEFKNNIKHGRGIFVWPTGNTYKGQFVEGIMEGQGEMTYCRGHNYRGSWANNMKNGFGVFTYFEGGHTYAGMFVNDERHGKGKMTFYPGTYLQETYEGDWEHDEMHGFGVYIYTENDGNVYEGQWEHNRRQGHGKLTFKDKSFYRGDFVQEMMHGKGIHVSADGTQYEGDWYENNRHGEGTLMATNGAIYQGTFYKNRRHGPGVEEYVDGNEYSGTWDENRVVGRGVVTLQCGKGSFGGPSKVRVKVFGF